MKYTKERIDFDNKIERFFERLKSGDIRTFSREIKDTIHSDDSYCYQYLFSEEKNILTTEILAKAFEIIEKNNLYVWGVVVNSIKYEDIRRMGNFIYDECAAKEIAKRERNLTKVKGHIWSADIYVCDLLEDNQIVLCSSDSMIFLDVRIKTPEKQVSQEKIEELKRSIETK